MPPSEQEAGNGEPLAQMLALEPLLEFCLASGAAIVKDCEYARAAYVYFAATTMISTL